MEGSKNSDQVNLVKAWLELPGEKPPLEQELADALERWIRADKWIRIHFSVSKVWDMMAYHYNYCDLTARRDVYDAQCFFSSTAKPKRSYWAGLVLERLGQAMMDAVADRKWGDMAKIAKEIREYMEFIQEVDQVDAIDLIKPVPRRIAFQPEILNVKHDPKAREKVLLLVREITGDNSIDFDQSEGKPDADLGTDETHALYSGSKSPNTQPAANGGDHLEVDTKNNVENDEVSRSSQTRLHCPIPRARDS